MRPRLNERIAAAFDKPGTLAERLDRARQTRGSAVNGC